MAGYRKKRRFAGPSKNEEKVARGKDAERRERMAATVGTVFPTIKRLSLKAAFLYPGTNVLGEEAFSLSAADPCRFSLPCPGRCGSARFELAPLIRKTVEQNVERLEISEKCAEPLYAGAAARCDTELRGELTVEYKPAPAPAAAPAAEPAPDS